MADRRLRQMEMPRRRRHPAMRIDRLEGAEQIEVDAVDRPYRASPGVTRAGSNAGRAMVKVSVLRR